MNKDQIKGRAKDLVGKMQEQAGKLSADSEHQAKGLGKQAAGKVQENYGDAKDAMRRTARKTH